MLIGNFLTLAECTKSNTAIKLGIPNIPYADDILAMNKFVENIYHPLCEHFNCKIPFSSFYRSPALNRKISGASSTSQHCLGEAMDIDVDLIPDLKLSNQQIYDFIINNLQFDQVINEFNYAWIHCSYSALKINRRMILSSERINGNIVYKHLNK
jgi:zinc D-Ala-D-Ala carboxypeptidase